MNSIWELEILGQIVSLDKKSFTLTFYNYNDLQKKIFFFLTWNQNAMNF